MSSVAQVQFEQPQEPPPPLVFTDSAASKVKELVDEEGNPDLKLRVFVQGGGCSGFQYGFTFDEVMNEDDSRMDKNGVTLFAKHLVRRTEPVSEAATAGRARGRGQRPANEPDHQPPAGLPAQADEPV